MMKCLKEPISRRANRQDKCCGSFFESRFKSVAVLDEEALLPSALSRTSATGSRFVYVPKHSPWLNQIEIFLGILQRKCLRGGNFTAVPELESQIRAFIIYYNTTIVALAGNHPLCFTLLTYLYPVGP